MQTALGTKEALLPFPNIQDVCEDCKSARYQGTSLGTAVPEMEPSTLSRPMHRATMGAAFDTAWQSFPPNLKDHEGARRKLALLILRHMDRGECDTTRLSDRALLDFMR
jgi:hypothetical protein